jgi:hypothetical protein
MGLFDIFKKKKKTPPPPPPPPLISVNLPAETLSNTLDDGLGNRFTTTSQGNTTRTQALLGEDTSRLLSTTQNSLTQGVEALNQSEEQTQTKVEQEASKLFSRLRGAMDDAFAQQQAQLQVAANKRFGGTLNTSFGAYQQANLQKAYHQSLANTQFDAYTQAWGQERNRQEQQTNRLRLLQDVLGDYQDRYENYSQLGNSVVSNRLSLLQQARMQADRLNRGDYQAQLNREAREEASRPRFNPADLLAVAIKALPTLLSGGTAPPVPA